VNVESKLKREWLVLRILFFPLSALQFFLVVFGWCCLRLPLEAKMGISLDLGVWLCSGMFLGLLFLVYPFYLKLTDAGNNRVYKIYNRLRNK